MFWRNQTDWEVVALSLGPDTVIKSISPFLHDIAFFYPLYFPLICLVLILDTSFHSISHHSPFILSVFAFCVIIFFSYISFIFSISVCYFNVCLFSVPFTAFYLQTAFLHIGLFYSFFFPLSFYTSFPSTWHLIFLFVLCSLSNAISFLFFFTLVQRLVSILLSFSFSRTQCLFLCANCLWEAG